MDKNLVLGIETSCDETGIGLVAGGRTMRANIVASQVEMHARYGGIVPEVASRQHVLALSPSLQRALSAAEASLNDIEAIAVTHGPGLAGALLSGVNFAKGLALGLDKPLLGINHLEGHIYAAWLYGRDPEAEVGFPLLVVIASGGHTDLLLMEGHGQYKLLGRTRDDAAGEAFDKAARVLGLGFPGGPEIQRAAAKAAKPGAPLPRAWLGDSLDFSFSGLKTAVLHRAREQGIAPPDAVDPAKVAAIAAAFQEAVCDVVSAKAVEAAKKVGARGIVLGGGVVANSQLRQITQERSPVPVFVPPPVLCTDNGAMIAACAHYRLRAGATSPLDLDAVPSLRLG